MTHLFFCAAAILARPSALSSDLSLGFGGTGAFHRLCA